MEVDKPGLKIFGPVGLFMKYNAYVPECRNEEGSADPKGGLLLPRDFQYLILMT